MDAQQWRAAVLDHLERGGPVCRRAAAYIRQHDVPIGFARQTTGARWTLRGAIELKSPPCSLQTSPADPWVLGIIVHEATHLQQGVARALSVEGEVEAWKAEQAARAELRAPLQDSPHLQAVALTPDAPTKRDLRQARAAMLAHAGWRYLVWLLPYRSSVWTRLIAAVSRVIFRTRKAGE